MDGMFYSARQFNADISRWDVSSHTNMRHMFNHAYVFKADHGPPAAWVTNMEQMFYACEAFDPARHNGGGIPARSRTCG